MWVCKHCNGEFDFDTTAKRQIIVGGAQVILSTSNLSMITEINHFG